MESNVSPLQIKYFDGNPSNIESAVNRFLKERGDNIEVINFEVVNTENQGSSGIGTCYI